MTGSPAAALLAHGPAARGRRPVLRHGERDVRAVRDLRAPALHRGLELLVSAGGSAGRGRGRRRDRPGRGRRRRLPRAGAPTAAARRRCCPASAYLVLAVLGIRHDVAARRCSSAGSPSACSCWCRVRRLAARGGEPVATSAGSSRPVHRRRREGHRHPQARAEHRRSCSATTAGAAGPDRAASSSSTSWPGPPRGARGRWSASYEACPTAAAGADRAARHAHASASPINDSGVAIPANGAIIAVPLIIAVSVGCWRTRRASFATDPRRSGGEPPPDGQPGIRHRRSTHPQREVLDRRRHADHAAGDVGQGHHGPARGEQGVQRRRGLRAQGDRARPLAGGRAVPRGHRLRLGEPLAGAAQGQRDLRPDRVRRRRSLQRVREPPHCRGAAGRHARLRLRPARRDRPRARERLRPDFGTIFSSGGEKPYEVEIFVAEVGDTVEEDSIYRLTYDGQVADEHGFAVMGGSTEKATAYLKDHYEAGAALDDAIRLAVQALGQGETETRSIPSGNLEVAVLDRTRTQQRKFRRLTAAQLHGSSVTAARASPSPAAAQRPTGPAPRPTPVAPTTRQTPPTLPATSRPWRTRSPGSPTGSDPSPRWHRPSRDERCLGCVPQPPL